MTSKINLFYQANWKKVLLRVKITLCGSWSKLSGRSLCCPLEINFWTSWNISVHIKKKHRLKGNIRLGSNAIVGTIATIVTIIAASSNLMQHLKFFIPLWIYLATHQIGFLCTHLQSWKFNVTSHKNLFFIALVILSVTLLPFWVFCHGLGPYAEYRFAW